MVIENNVELKVQKIAVRDLKPGANVRKAVSDDEIAALAISLKANQWQPILVAPDMAILDGWRRYLAAMKAQIEFLWAIVTERALTAPERIAAQLVMGLHRKDFTEQEKVLACEEWMQSCPGLDQKQLAAKLDADPATVCKWLSVSSDRVIPEVRSSFLNGSIKLMHAYCLSQAPKSHQAELLKFALSGATRAQIETQVRSKKEKTASVQVNRVRCLLPGGMAITLSGEGMSVDTVIDHLTTLLSEAKKARNLDIRTFERVMADKAKEQRP